MLLYFKKVLLGTCLFLVLLIALGFNQIGVKYSSGNQDQLLIRVNAPLWQQGVNGEESVDVNDPTATFGQAMNNSRGQVELLVTEAPEYTSACKPSKPTKESEDLAKKIFFSKQPPTCGSRKPWEICFIWIKQSNLKVRCRSDLCNGPISAGIIAKDTGVMAWRTLTSIDDLEDWILRLIKQEPANKNYGFCLIKCTHVSANKMDQQAAGNGSNEVQLLILPPQLGPVKWKAQSSTLNSQEEISVNVVHIDALSRDHFIRSLPKTISVIKRLKSMERENIEVLDFSLLQTIKARTYESLKILFTGELPIDIDLMKNPFDEDEVPLNTSITFDFIFRSMKQKGFQTLYIDDLCWYSNWGLAKHLGIRTDSFSHKKNWKLFQEALISNHIEDIGPSIASCSILEAHGIEDPFQGPEQICFNGYHQQHYLLKYLVTFQEIMKSMHKNFFSFFMSNVAHEPTGRRVQTLDSDLANYLTSLSKISNVLTIITSDHGNSYGEYVESTFRGRLETYNPPLFMIIPRSISNQKGKVWLDSLKANQKNLITYLEVHLFLRSLTRKDNDKFPQRSDRRNKRRLYSEMKAVLTNVTLDPKGKGNPLVESVLDKRTCDDIPLLVDTICLCEDHYTHAIPQPRYFLLAMFAVGEINNIVGRQRVKFHSHHRERIAGCLPLALHDITNSWIRHDNDVNTARISFVAKVDLFAINLKDENVTGRLKILKEIFTVTVSWKVNSVPGIVLSSVTRISSYGQYKHCLDKGVEPKYCVCIQNADKSSREWGEKLHTDDAILLNGSRYLSQKHIPLVSNMSESGKPRGSNDQNVEDDIVAPAAAKVSLSHRSPKPSVPNTGRAKWISSEAFYVPREMFSAMESRAVPKSQCLQVQVLRSSMGAVFWMSNICRKDIVFNFDLFVTNMDISIGNSLRKTIAGRDAIFIAVCVQSRPNLEWRWKYVARELNANKLLK